MMNAHLRVFPKFVKRGNTWEAFAKDVKGEYFLGPAATAEEAVFIFDRYKKEHDENSIMRAQPKRAIGYKFAPEVIKRLTAKKLSSYDMFRAKHTDKGIVVSKIFLHPVEAGPFLSYEDCDSLMHPLVAHFERHLWKEINEKRWERAISRSSKPVSHWEILDPDFPVVQNTHVAMVIFNKIAHEVGFFSTMYDARAAAKQAAREFSCQHP